MEPTELNHAAYNKIAKDWMKDHEHDDWWYEGTETFLKLLPKGGRVLDVGCAGGWKTRYMVDRGFNVTGFDLSESFIDLARDLVPEATFEVLDLHQTETISGTFDGVFVQAVLLHVPKNEVVSVMAKLTVKIKPGGYLYVAVKEQRPDKPPEEELLEDDYGYSYRRFFSYYTLPELEEYFSGAGLEITYKTVTTSGKTNWIQIIGRIRVSSQG
ncbi:MAG: methyltransferase domain-containing protein [Patescibacteria group bacterium]